MSSTPKSSAKPRQSLFYRDLASPFSTTRSASRFAASSPSLFRSSENNPPPPPVFTLEDRVDFSPEPPLPASPETYPDPKTPTPLRNYHSTPSPARRNAVSSDEKGKGLSSPVNGVVVNSGTPKMKELIMLPPPREAVRPEMKDRNVNRMALTLSGGVDEEEWVTVYGFSPGDTNLVLREFEKCGVILKHITGPRDANWMHILYQNRYDAQKALGKNGMQLNSVLIIGVKPIDPMQRQYLNESLNSSTSNGGGFMVSLPSTSTPARSTGLEPAATFSRPHYLQNGSFMSNDRHHSTGAVAAPAKSVVSRVMDMMFSF